LTDVASCIVPRFLSAEAWDDLAGLDIEILSTNASGLDWPWLSRDHALDLARLRATCAHQSRESDECFAIRFVNPADLGEFVRRHAVTSVYALIERRPGQTFLALVPPSCVVNGRTV
jgi:hypothetical protein